MLPLVSSRYLHKNEYPFVVKMLCTSKIILKIAVFVTVIIFAVNLISCGDDTVTVVEEEFDPPRFNWRSVEVPNTGYADIWALDTNNIFLLNQYYQCIYRINNGVISTYNIAPYGFNQMQGISNNEIYIFGSTNGITPSIIKWDGAGFTSYPTNITMTGSMGINNKHFLRNSNEIWICTKRGIAKFNGVNYDYFSYDDSTMTPFGIFLSERNTIQYICLKVVDSTGETIQALYELQDNTFMKIFEYSENPNITGSYIYLKEIRGNKFGIKINYNVGANWSMCYYDFNTYSFLPGFCFSSKFITLQTDVRSINPAGANLNNYIMFIESESGFFEHYRGGFVHWNGSKFSKEFGVGGTGSLFYKSYILFNISDVSYLILQPYSLNDINCTLYIGTQK